MGGKKQSEAVRLHLYSPLLKVLMCYFLTNTYP